MKRLLSLGILFVSILVAQTQIQPIQIFTTVVIQPPLTFTAFPEWNQTVFILAPGTNVEVVKVEVFRNGIMQSDVNGPRWKRDYSLSADKKTVIFEMEARITDADIIRILYWLK